MLNASPWPALIKVALILGIMAGIVPVSTGLGAASGPVQITEFMAANESGLEDEDGDRPDWIEIHNSTGTVNLEGWYLTNDTNRLTLWRFPKYTLFSNEFVVVFASGKDRAQSTNQLHTNFRLPREGGYLALVQSNGVTVVSDFGSSYPAQKPDISHGRVVFMPDVTGAMPSPTPGQHNVMGGPGFSPEVVFSRGGGLFSDPFELTLSHPVPGGVVRYTTNGLAPTESSQVYSGPLPITARTQVRARAFTEGLLPGPVRTEVYLQVQPPLLSFKSQLPVVVIDSFGRVVPESGDQPGYMVVFEPGTNGITETASAPTFTSRVAMDRRGSSTLNQAKPNYNVELWNETADDRKVSLLGLPEESDFILYAPFNWDPSLMRNALIFSLARQIGRYAPRHRFVEVFASSSNTAIASNTYAGVYVLLEKVKADTHRVDIDRLEPHDNGPTNITGGYIVKIDRVNAGETGFYAGTTTFAHVEPQEAELRTPQRAPQRAWVTDRMNELASVLEGPDWTNRLTGYRRYIDVGSWIDYHLLNTLSGNVDAFRFSAFIQIHRNGPIAFGPLWDMDRSMGSTDPRDDQPRLWSAGGSDFFNAPWWNRILADPDFWQQWVDRWQELRSTTLTTNGIAGLIDSMNLEMGEAVTRDFNKWRQPKRGGNQAGELRELKDWIANRMDYIDVQFIPKPEAIHTNGQVVAHPAPDTTLYFTLDGSDPRAPGGAPSAAARRYENPVTVGSTALVTLRAFSPKTLQFSGGPLTGNFWSGPVRVRVTPAQPPRPGDLLLDELHADPAPPSPAELSALPGIAAVDLEFLEIRNRAPHPVDLFGIHFGEGVSFAMEDAAADPLGPGELLVLARNPQALRLRHPAMTARVLPFEGRLANEGETLKLLDSAGMPLFEFPWSEQWTNNRPGRGHSLVLRSNGLRAGDGWLTEAAWSPAGGTNGTPGFLEPDYLPGESIDVWRDRHFDALERSDPALSGNDADPDGDGVNNASEYTAGTHPRDPSHRLTITSFVPLPGGPILRWPATGGKRYRLQQSPALDATSWANGIDLGVIDTTRWMELEVPASADTSATRFYRIVVE